MNEITSFEPYEYSDLNETLLASQWNKSIVKAISENSSDATIVKCLLKDEGKECRVQIHLQFKGNAKARKQKSFSYRKFGYKGAYERANAYKEFVEACGKLPTFEEEESVFRNLECVNPDIDIASSYKTDREISMGLEFKNLVTTTTQHRIQDFVPVPKTIFETPCYKESYPRSNIIHPEMQPIEAINSPPPPVDSYYGLNCSFQVDMTCNWGNLNLMMRIVMDNMIILEFCDLQTVSIFEQCCTTSRYILRVLSNRLSNECRRMQILPFMNNDTQLSYLEAKLFLINNTAVPAGNILTQEIGNYYRTDLSMVKPIIPAKLLYDNLGMTHLGYYYKRLKACKASFVAVMRQTDESEDGALAVYNSAQLWMTWT